MGVVSALVISFIIGLNCTVTHEEFVHYDFNQMMRLSSFRTYAVGVMENEMVECEQKCTAAGAGATCTANCKQKWSIDWVYTDSVTSKTYDLKAAMLVKEDYDDSSKEPRIQEATQLLVHEFPMEKMLIWNTLRGKSAPSLKILQYTWWSTVFVGVPLFASIVLYVVLQLSDARQTEGNLYSFYFAPLIVMLYLLLAAGILIDVMSIAEIFYARHPSPRGAARSNDGPMLFVAICLVLIVVYILLLLVRVVMQKRKNKDEDPQEVQSEAGAAVPEAERESI